MKYSVSRNNSFEKLLYKIVYRKMKSLPVTNPYFSISMYFARKNSLYILADKVSEELNKYQDNEIKWLFYTSENGIDTSKSILTYIWSVGVPMFGLFIAATTDILALYLTIFISLIYFVFLTSREDLQHSYYRFYYNRIKAEAIKRNLDI